MTPRTVPIVCAKAPRHFVWVPAVREPIQYDHRDRHFTYEWYCSFCGARVKVVA